MLIAYPYLLLFSIFLCWHYYHRRFQKKIAIKKRKFNLYREDWVVIIIYLLFYGLRGFIFTDCFQYYDHFTNGANTSFTYDFVTFRYEPGYVLCTKVIRLFTGNFFVFQFIWTFIDVFLLIVILKREAPRCYLLAFSLLIPFFDGVQMNLFRNIKGMLVCFYAVKYIRKKQLIKYTQFILLASTLHISSILFLPLYFVVNRNIRYMQVGMFLVALVLYFMNLKFLNNFFLYIGVITGGGKIDQIMYSYANSTTSAGFTLGFIYRVCLFVSLIIYYKKIAAKNQIMLNVALLYLFCFTAFNSILVMRDRFGQMFSLGIVCILPYIFSAFKKTYRVYFVLFNLMCLYGQVYVQHNNAAAIYENVLTGISDRHKAYLRIFKAADSNSNR